MKMALNAASPIVMGLSGSTYQTKWTRFPIQLFGNIVLSSRHKLMGLLLVYGTVSLLNKNSGKAQRSEIFHGGVYRTGQSYRSLGKRFNALILAALLWTGMWEAEHQII
jgi:hypothetical protein